ncbi:hypothetical protein FDP41_002850 [Naegleria fowleri]|uniref:F-box domain-containing protein n=1 Tax=Naegleria fowleri TaxID=5763 RepID=A0A6A5BY94_NAEFO|nr:uncharacterized protein FDP41_002850 [Naegleria fowleri]KAF0978335.1 hypothetical protein FDP41_002850 [Naegleria fowleri]
MSSLDDLVLSKILGFLSMSDFRNSQPFLVCKHWHKFMNSEHFALMYLENQWYLNREQKQVLKDVDQICHHILMKLNNQNKYCQRRFYQCQDHYYLSELKRIYAFFILDRFGNELFFRNFNLVPLGDPVRHCLIKQKIISCFVENVIDVSEIYHVKPIFHSKGRLFVFISKQDLHLVVVSNSIRNNAMEMICLLYKMHDLMCKLLGTPLQTNTIPLNYSLLWQLVDEMICLGITENTNENALKSILEESLAKNGSSSPKDRLVSFLYFLIIAQ